MKNGFRVFLASFLALGLSWCGFVLASVRQLGTEKQTTVLNSSDIYPEQRPGDAALGLQVYRANGCAACHTEQVRQDGVTCEVELTGVGNNPAAVEKQINANLPVFSRICFVTNTLNLPYGGPFPVDVSHLPRTIANHLEKTKADAMVDGITAVGGKSEIHIIATGADIARGWGLRQSVAEDYLWDAPVQPGSLRAGPDLSNIGLRDPDLNWQLVHLFAPQSLAKNSAMPPFRYLFQLRKIADTPSSDALQFPKGFGPPAGFEVVPKPVAKELASYLLSLKSDVPLHDAPFTPAIAKPE